ncbi:hypothetical protein QTP88_006718 [Uroleucon formosanum]
MWCEEFLLAYRSAPVEHISKYYDRLSVFVEASGDGRWTEPATGAHEIADRLISLNVSGGCGWPVVTCQRTRSDGLIVVLAAEDGYRRQILIVHWRAADRRAVVSNHFYVTTTAGGEHESDDDQDGDGVTASFHNRFEGWAGRQDRSTLVRFQMALCTGLTVVRDYYTTPPGHSVDRTDCHQYDRTARFSYTKANGGGGGCVYTGPRAIRKQYERLAMDNRCVKLRTVETCWSGHSGSITGTTVALILGVMPKVTRPGRALAFREFVQLFVIDVHTRKILNDVLCFEPRRHGSNSPSSRISGPSSLSSASSTSSTPSSLSSLSSTSPSQPLPLPLSYPNSTSSNPMFSFFYTFSRLQSLSPSSNKIDDHWPTISTGVSNENGDQKLDTSELVALRSRFTTNTLGIRFAAISPPCAIGSGAGGGSDQQQQNVTPSKLNPRQLFIGCVPLHVKYGQLKLLFEQFGEVTYVKVYEGYNKQTGVKMSHNYAFLFFKDEKSVEKAIAASPIPLDSNWNLNVSRPHHHTTTVGTCDR